MGHEPFTKLLECNQNVALDASLSNWRHSAVGLQSGEGPVSAVHSDRASLTTATAFCALQGRRKRRKVEETSFIGSQQKLNKSGVAGQRQGCPVAVVAWGNARVTGSAGSAGHRTGDQ